MNQVSAQVEKLDILTMKMMNFYTHFDWAIVALGNRLRFQVALQISIKVILKEFLQSLPITPTLNIAEKHKSV